MDRLAAITVKMELVYEYTGCYLIEDETRLYIYWLL